MLLAAESKKEKLSASSNLLEDQTKDLMDIERTPYLSSKKLKRKDGTAKLSSSKMIRLIKSTKKLSTNIVAISEESTLDLFLITKKYFSTLCANFQKLDFMECLTLTQ